MYRKVDVSVTEMRRLREEGYSNKDIANILEVSAGTVYRYIGGQGKRMESVIPEVKPAVCVEVEKPSLPVVKTVSETIAVNGFLFRRDGDNNTMSVYEPNSRHYITFPFDRLQDYHDALLAAQAHFEAVSDNG